MKELNILRTKNGSEFSRRKLKPIYEVKITTNSRGIEKKGQRTAN